MSEFIKREDAENAIIGRCEESALWKLRHLPSADVVEVSKILKTADEQEKQGFIQTAMILRELVK